jgi:hypothetical protein
MGRTDFLLDLIRTHNVAAVSALIGLFIVSRLLPGSRRSQWIVLLFGALAVILGFALSRR